MGESTELKIHKMVLRGALERSHKLYGRARAGAQSLAENKPRSQSHWTKGQRKEGVKRENKRKERKKSTKIPLTRKRGSHDTPIAPVTVFPL
jgi:hypothetical protein